MNSAGPLRLDFRLKPTCSGVVNEPGRLPRITRLLALALRFDGQIRNQAVKDYAQLARLSGVSRARVSQIMNLLNLAPSLQEQILFFARVHGGPDPITEKDLRGVCALSAWSDQQRLWNRLMATRARRADPAGQINPSRLQQINLKARPLL
jgi:hypothetical protein